MYIAGLRTQKVTVLKSCRVSKVGGIRNDRRLDTFTKGRALSITVISDQPLLRGSRQNSLIERVHVAVLDRLYGMLLGGAYSCAPMEL
jgi:hypothetical protein